MRKLKGSLTIFFSLILVVTMTLVFALAELVRLHALTSISQNVTEGAVESGFSEFNRFLWENYDILAIDLGFDTSSSGPTILEDKIKYYAQNNISPPEGMNMLRLEVGEVEATQYSLLTDDFGIGVVKQSVQSMKSSLVETAVDELVQNLESIEIEKKDVEGDYSEYVQKFEVESDDDPLLQLLLLHKDIEASPHLTVSKDPLEISYGSIGHISRPSKRNLDYGNYKDETGISYLDKILYVRYLTDHFGSAVKPLDVGDIDYQVEYLIAGFDDDKDNLGAVSQELVLIRNAMNLACILASPSMMAKVTELATSLSLGDPVKIGILEPLLIEAWAYVESVLEVRNLLAGGSVARIKTEADWTCDLLNLRQFMWYKVSAKTVEGGIDYTQYLERLLLLQSIENLGIRNCDLLENALTTQEEYSQCRLDNMLYRGNFVVSYHGSELFFSLFHLGNYCLNEYEIKGRKEISY